ncbi:MAG: rod shape-determining protein [Clostridia bacterium]|nr:rod shape-determining protein [Clostridia bacterium]
MAIFAPDVAIDLGTCNTLVYVRGRGIVISEPSIVVISSDDRHMVRAVGNEARILMGRTRDNLSAISPIQGGSLDEFGAAQVLITYFMRKAIGSSFLFRPRVLVAVPSGLSNIAKRAVMEAVHSAGGKQVILVEKALAAAIGSGLNAWEAVGSMVVDIGGGTTDTAVVSMGGIVVSQSIQVGGNRMDEAIINYLKRNSSMLIGNRTAEEVKIDLACAIPIAENRRVHIRGRDLLSSHAMNVEFTAAQAQEAMIEPCRNILASIKWVLERTPPDLSADIHHSCIHLTGGASQLPGLDRMIGVETGIPVAVARAPEDCTITGLGYFLENPDLITQLASSSFAKVV